MDSAIICLDSWCLATFPTTQTGYPGVVMVVGGGSTESTGNFGFLGEVEPVLLDSVEAIPIYVEELLLLLTCCVEGTS